MSSSPSYLYSSRPGSSPILSPPPLCLIKFESLTAVFERATDLIYGWIFTLACDQFFTKILHFFVQPESV